VVKETGIVVTGLKHRKSLYAGMGDIEIDWRDAKANTEGGVEIVPTGLRDRAFF
jgi:hypothetical protein